MAKTKNKKKGIITILTVILLAVMVVSGYFVAKYITRDDVFEVIGDKEVTIFVGEIYEDEGARAISFGRDITDKIVAENTVDNQTAGRYYIKYTVDDIRYKDVARYRVVIVVDGNAEGEVDNENN